MAEGTDVRFSRDDGDSPGRIRRWLADRSESIVLGYPLVMLAVFFVIPLLLLIATSFYPKPSGEYYEVGFTLEHYVRLFTVPLYLERLAFTIALSMGTAFACLAIGYPVAYTLARMDSKLKRQVYITTIVSTMWLTYIIRSYAWTVILSKNGVLNSFLLTVGVVDEALSLTPGIWALSIGMTYVFLPFAILTLYSSINNINLELEEASKNLGADRLQTFRRVTLPLSKNGIYSAWMLVFILALGAYIVPRILGTPAQWTLPVIIGNQSLNQLNVPFGAALSLVMMVVVVAILAAGYKFLGLTSGDVAGAGGGSNE
ncbi:ABC transporter permease [Halorussus sp. AFM4]|uniref:ABC transporter permease n=1 Tax=Halorussus sp. AFM4 TaxID=3421651 RepID=UPI003EBCC9A1